MSLSLLRAGAGKPEISRTTDLPAAILQVEPRRVTRLRTAARLRRHRGVGLTLEEVIPRTAAVVRRIRVGAEGERHIRAVAVEAAEVVVATAAGTVEHPSLRALTESYSILRARVQFKRSGLCVGGLERDFFS
jgi:hypothetical protein